MDEGDGGGVHELGVNGAGELETAGASLVYDVDVDLGLASLRLREDFVALAGAFNGERGLGKKTL